MSLVQDKQKRMKIKAIFNKYSNGMKKIPNQKIKKFWEQLGLASDIFFHDFYYYFPDIQKGNDLSYDDCLAFIDYILTPKHSNKQIVNVFKTFDKNGIGHIGTSDLLNLLRKELPTWQYEKYAQIITTYGPSINYIDMFEKIKDAH